MPSKYRTFTKAVERKLRGPLPGLPSQMRMATMRRAMRDGKMQVPEDARKAGVLILFYLKDDQIHIPFIKRNEYPGVHSGQVSFPGGGWEPGDADIIATALRETEEEIGIDRSLVTPIGKLSELFIPPSNFLVTPVVGYMNGVPAFKPEPEEVDMVIEVPLEELLAPHAIKEKEITIFPDVRLKVPCFYCNSQVIWGATAMMLCELVDVINQEF
jgi:8-oxo-dGTP pyrophosphatase MutT (NUDIX family)